MRSILILLTITIFIQSCDIATLNNEGITSVSDGTPLETIEVAGVLPTSSEDLFTILTNGTSRNWKATGFQILRIDGFQSCRLDDQVILNADGTYSYDGGSDLCGAEDDTRIKTGTWEMDFEGETLIFDRGTDIQAVAEIAEATESRLILRGQYFGWDLIGRYEVEQ